MLIGIVTFLQRDPRKARKWRYEVTISLRLRSLRVCFKRERELPGRELGGGGQQSGGTSNDTPKLG